VWCGNDVSNVKGGVRRRKSGLFRRFEGKEKKKKNLKNNKKWKKKLKKN